MPASDRPGPVFRLARCLLVVLALLTALVWLVTTQGLYVWFNVGAEDRIRIEYGRVVWRHVEGGTVRTTAGVDGGAKRALWTFERSGGATRSTTRIPLWMPFALFAGGALGMTLARRARARRAPQPEATAGP